MLAARNLGKRFGDRWLFRHVELEVGLGDRLLVTGRNGAGKSTLLKALAGLLPLTEGEVDRPDEARRQLGYAALDGRLWPALSPREHLLFTARGRGIPYVDELALYGLDGAADEPSVALSSGQRARLRLAIALQSRPTVLLLDEPGVSLDEEGRALVDRVVAEQTERGALVLATNDPLERRHGTAELFLD